MAKSVAKKYDAAFKQQCVERYLQSGTTLKAVAETLKIRSETLSGWVKAYQKANANVEKTSAAADPTAKKTSTPQPTAKKGSARLKTASPDKKQAVHAEVEQLRKDLKMALEENATLKKAMRFLFASSP